jgi:hypothetical protein
MGNNRTKPARRTLRFERLDDLTAEVDRMAAAAAQGRACPGGTWTLGQIFNHLAAWAEYSYTGMPLKVPWVIRLLMRMRRRAFFNDPMPAGVRIPRVNGGTLATEPAELEPALARYRAVLDRLAREAPARAHPIFGALTHEEWIKLQLRHAELHLGFVRID